MVSCNCKCTFGNIGKKATISHNMVIRLYIDTLHVFMVPLHGPLYLIWKAAPQTSPSCFGNLLKGTCATGDVKVSGCRNQQKWHLQLYSCDLWEGTCVKGRWNLQWFWQKCNPEGQLTGLCPYSEKATTWNSTMIPFIQVWSLISKMQRDREERSSRLLS